MNPIMTVITSNRSFISSFSSVDGRPWCGARRIRKRVRDDWSGSLRRRNTGGSEHDVLLASMHIRHWYACLCAGRNLCFPDNLSGLLIVGAKYGLTAVTFTGEQECLGR